MRHRAFNAAVDRARGHHRVVSSSSTRPPHIQLAEALLPPCGSVGTATRSRGRRYGDFYPCPEATEQQMAERSPSCAPSSSSATSLRPQPLVATCSWRPIGKRHSGVHEGGEGALHRYASGARRVHRGQLKMIHQDDGSHADLGSPRGHRVTGGLIERLPIDPVIFKPHGRP